MVSLVSDGGVIGGVVGGSTITTGGRGGVAKVVALELFQRTIPELFTTMFDRSLELDISPCLTRFYTYQEKFEGGTGARGGIVVILILGGVTGGFARAASVLLIILVSF